MQRSATCLAMILALCIAAPAVRGESLDVPPEKIEGARPAR